MYSTIMPDEDIRLTMEEMIKDIPKITEELQGDINLMDVSFTKH